MLTYEKAHELFEYRLETGELVRKIGRQACRAGDVVGAKQFQKNGKPMGLRVMVDHKNYFVHRVAWLMQTGAWPDRFIDHIDGNPFNNKWDNLREANASENLWNVGKYSTNTSGYKGVSFYKRDKLWQSHISVNGKERCLGRFPTPELAYEAYCNAAKEHHGEFVRLS